MVSSASHAISTKLPPQNSSACNAVWWSYLHICGEYSICYAVHEYEYVRRVRVLRSMGRRFILIYDQDAQLRQSTNLSRSGISNFPLRPYFGLVVRPRGILTEGSALNWTHERNNSRNKPYFVTEGKLLMQFWCFLCRTDKKGERIVIVLMA